MCSEQACAIIFCCEVSACDLSYFMGNQCQYFDHFGAGRGILPILLIVEVGGGLIGYVKSKPLGTGQIISIDVLVIVMIIAVQTSISP